MMRQHDIKQCVICPKLPCYHTNTIIVDYESWDPMGKGLKGSQLCIASVAL